MSNRDSFAQALRCFADTRRRNEYFHLYSDDIVVHGYQGIEPGLDSVKQFYYGFWRVFPDAQVIAQDLIGEGDTLVARYTTMGTMHEEFMGVAATGQRIELPGISILHFRNGQCFERWTCSDSLILLNQIGASVGGASLFQRNNISDFPSSGRVRVVSGWATIRP
jgi:predicted ester cyclase